MVVLQKNEREKMIRKNVEKKRILILVLIGSFLFIIGITSYLYFGAEQIQRRMKERVCDKVIAHEDELSEIVKEVSLEETLFFREMDTDSSINFAYYKELEDERIDKVFKEFFLMRIGEDFDESIVFAVRPTVISALWDDYMYGFYYTENDEPIDVEWGNEMEENEFEAVVVGFGKYWYRTEKITDNWWFYETKILYLYPTKR